MYFKRKMKLLNLIIQVCQQMSLKSTQKLSDFLQNQIPYIIFLTALQGNKVGNLVKKVVKLGYFTGFKLNTLVINNEQDNTREVRLEIQLSTAG